MDGLHFIHAILVFETGHQKNMAVLPYDGNTATLKTETIHSTLKSQLMKSTELVAVRVPQIS